MPPAHYHDQASCPEMKVPKEGLQVPPGSVRRAPAGGGSTEGGGWEWALLRLQEQALPSHGFRMRWVFFLGKEYSHLPKAKLVSRSLAPSIWVHASRGHREKPGCSLPGTMVYSHWLSLCVAQSVKAACDAGHRCGAGGNSQAPGAGVVVAFMTGRRCIFGDLHGFQQTHPSGCRKDQPCHSLPRNHFGGLFLA